MPRSPELLFHKTIQRFIQQIQKVFYNLTLGYVKIWDVRLPGTDKKSLIKSYKPHKERINSILLIDQYIITASDDKTIVIAD
jgi:WD40 repeat protein